MLSGERLRRDFELAGLAPGQRLIVHSSLKSLGKVKGGADTVIDALQAVVGPVGTIVMPAFTYSLKMWTKEPFDIASTPSRTGLITDVFWRRPDVIRTDHPTHSYGCWGSEADVISAGQRSAAGDESPLGWLADHGGVVVQIGTGQGSNTALHLCEERAQVPYLDTAFTPGQGHEIAHRLNADGRAEEVRIEPVPGSSGGFSRIDPVLEAAGIIQEARVGEATVKITPLAALVGTVVATLRRHPGLLLSRSGDDENSQARRARLHREPEHWNRDLIDLYIEGFPGGLRLRWPEREAIEPAARRLAEQALALCADRSVGGLRAEMKRLGIRIEESERDSFVFSMWDAGERTIRLWHGALERLAEAAGESGVPCAQPLRALTGEMLRDLALVHESFHALCPAGSDSLQARLAEEIAARLFADAVLELPFPALLVDVWLMHWAGDETLHRPNAPEAV